MADPLGDLTPLEDLWLSSTTRVFVELAAEAARAQFDPQTQWDEFVEALWYQLQAGFGLTADEAVPLTDL